MSQSDSKYTLLYKRPTPARAQTHYDLAEFRTSDLSHFEAGPFALDFEANTNKPHRKDLWLRSMAIANDNEVVAIDFKDCSQEDLDWCLGWVSRQEMVTFNHIYEGGLLLNKTGLLTAPLVDVYSAFKALGGKKYADSVAGHSLKSAQVELLGWAEKGNAGLEEHKEAMNYGWEDIAKYDKDIILHYNGLDADSTWALYGILKDTVKRHWDTWGEHFGSWHSEDCLNMTMLWVEALNTGMPIDLEQLTQYTEHCTQLKQRSYDLFMEHELIAPGIKEYNDAHLSAILDVHDNYIKVTKSGKVSANWQIRLDQHEASKNINHFNLNSWQQLQWLLYDKAGIRSPKANMSTDKESLQQIGEVGEMLLAYREAKTELQFLNQLSVLEEEGILYPNIVVPGTDTMRCTSREDIK